MKRLLFAVAFLSAVLAGCGMFDGSPARNQPGTIAKTETRTATTLPSMKIVLTVNAASPAEAATFVEALKTGTTSTVTQTLVQPENPAGFATLTQDGQASGAVIPASYKPDSPPPPPTPSDKAIGALVWICGIVALLGGILLVLKLMGVAIPFLAWLAVVPVGVPAAMLVGGIAGVFVLSWWADAAGWVKLLVVLGLALAVGLVVSMSSNWKQAKKVKAAKAASPAPAPTIAPPTGA